MHEESVDSDVIDFEDVGLDVDINATDYGIEDGSQLKAKVLVKSFVGKSDIDMKDALEEIRKSKDSNKEDDVMVARIDGSFEDYVKMMTDKYSNMKIELDNNRIVIDSYDGAEHKKTTKGKVGLVSFNSQLLSPSSITKCSPASSLNILTWQQLVGEEKLNLLIPALKGIYKSRADMRRKELEEDGKPMHTFYQLHDGKMLYLLTQHSLFNRKNYPFLSYACQRGARLRN